MTPAEIAERLTGLNWSGVPVTHRLAVAAAVETLKRFEPMQTAVEALKVLTEGVQPVSSTTFDDPRIEPDRTDLYRTAAERIEREMTDVSNLVVLPVKPRTCWTSLCNLEGKRLFTSSHFGPGGAWNWIVDTVMHEHSCDEDDVNCVESGEDQPYDCDDLVTLRGEPVYRIEHWSSPGVK